jgi:hypothetical protein
MNRNFNYTSARYGIYFLSILLIICLCIPAPAQADTSDILKWAKVGIPGIAGNIIVPNSEISKIAVSAGDVIFALDTPNDKLYRSQKGGSSWDDITGGVQSAGALPKFTNIAVAPDKPQVVALVTLSGGINYVFLSTDGGDSWINTNADIPPANGTIQCITISRAYSPDNKSRYWDIAIGTAIWGNGATDGQIWTIQVGGMSAWKNQNMTAADISAIAFSPNYALDGTILVVASDITTTILCQGKRDMAAQTTTWNNVIGYPVLIDSKGEVPLPVPPNRVISSISLPSDYNGDNPSNRVAFLSYNRQAGIINEAANGVYRCNPNELTGKTPLITGIDISSIALYGTIKTGTAGVGSGWLLAGDYAPITGQPFVQVRRCGNPFDLPPISPSWSIAEQPPTGPGSAQVAWSSDGTVAYCGTGRATPVAFDESAFSRSQDLGNNWEQVGLINTAIRICDFAPAPDSKSLFIATYSSGAFEWVWRTAGEPLGMYWGRVFGLNTSSNRLIIRLSPDYEADGTMYALEVEADVLAPPAKPKQLGVSHTRGNSWVKRYIPADVIDAVVVDSKTLYVALPNGIIRKTTSEGMIWQKPMATGLDAEINMLSLTKNGHLLIGSRNGKVLYSTDGGDTFIEIPQLIPRLVNITTPDIDVQVIADSQYNKNNTIYAATNIADMGIWRWTVGSSTAWEQVDKTVTDLRSGEQFCGLAVGEEGTLYALRMEEVKEINGLRRGGMNRSLNPAEPKATKIEWDVINRTLPVGIAFDPKASIPAPSIPPILFTHVMPFLKLSGNFVQNDLWSFNTADVNNPIIYRFQDNLCKVGAWINPVPQIGCDPASGRNQGFNFIWEQLSLSDQYGIQIAKDKDFTLGVLSEPHYATSNNITNVTGVLKLNATGALTRIPATSDRYYIPQALTSPAFAVQAGQEDGVTQIRLLPYDSQFIPLSFECGHGYFWRIRTRHAATGEFIRSPWSKTGDLILKAGFLVTTPYLGPQLLAPDNGCGCACTSPVAFSWTPFKETNAYWFELSENADMSDPLVSTAVAGTTAYQYDGALKCNKNYFWSVMAVEPAPSEWSAVFSFATGSEIQPVTRKVILETTPLVVWMILGCGTLLVISILALIIRTRRE